jgi:hypothetical protein
MTRPIDYNRFSDIMSSPYENEELDPSWAIEPTTYQVAHNTDNDIERAHVPESPEMPQKPQQAVISWQSTSTINNESNIPPSPSTVVSNESSNTSISDIQKEKDLPPPLPEKHGSTLTRYLAREYKLLYKVFEVGGFEVPFVLLIEA